MAKNYYRTALIIDGVDFLLGIPSLVVSLTGVGAPIAVVVNNVKGVVYDAIASVILFNEYGIEAGIAGATETILPEEIDFLVPSATIGAYLARNKK